MSALVAVLFVIGYPVSLVVIVRLLPVVRQRRRRWFLAHQLAVAAIVAGWAILERPLPVAVNAAWWVVVAAWYAAAARADGPVAR